MPADVDALVAGWVAEYSRSDVAVAGLLCDRHPREKVALHHSSASGRQVTLTFADLSDLSSRFAGALADMGVSPGDRVATLLPKSPELMVTTVGLWRLGAAHVPLFTAFGPEAVGYRVGDSGARVVVTDAVQRDKLRGLAGEADLRVVTVEEAGEAAPEGDVGFGAALEKAQPLPAPAVRSGEDLLILLYTSGTTGHPKGVEVPVKALAEFEQYLRLGLDVREDDVHWNIADPGWAYGLYFGLVGTLLVGKAVIFHDAPFEPAAVYGILERHRVTNLAAAPTVYRALRAAGAPPGATERLALRAASSAGEPLNPDVVSWAEDHLGVPVHDHYGQTELGMAVVNHHHPALRRPIKPGSMGHATPGYRAVVVDDSGEELGPGEEGQLAVDTAASPLYWFRGYYRDPERTAERLAGGGRYYLTGDAASCDEEGYLFFSSRADDVITSAGYRIGPFEVESSLMAHGAVAEAAVVGSPDELRGEVVKAFVVLVPGRSPSEELADELRAFVKTRLSAHAYPREIAFVGELPKTPSGKVQRFLLRGR